jgi:hypothetical protein
MRESSAAIGLVVASRSGKRADDIPFRSVSVPAGQLPVIGISVPLPSDPSTLPSTSLPLSYRVTWTGRRDNALTGSLKKLCSSGPTPTLDIDVQTAQLDEPDWEALESFVSDILDFAPAEAPKPNIILCTCHLLLIHLYIGALMSTRNYIANILPPPRSLEIKTVKLLTDPIYLSYQSHTATFSLMTSVYVKYAPPAWGPVPIPNDDGASDHTEWKRRIKMYCTYALLFPLYIPYPPYIHRSSACSFFK